MLFRNEYYFLSNFYTASFELDGVKYKTSEHAYQCAKTTNPKDFQYILDAPNGAEAKKRGRAIQVRPDFDANKKETMLKILRAKYVFNPAIASQLIATQGIELIEENYWGDTYWGVCKGVGENNLGKLLMQVRSELISLISLKAL